MTTTRGQRTAIFVVLLFCVASRVGWVLHVRDANPSATTTTDTPSYVQPARALVEDGALVQRPGSSDPIYVRTPGYPLAIATVFAVHESETLFLVLQAVLSCLTVWLAYLVAAWIWRPTVGIVAAALLALEPLQFVASGSLLTESLFSLALLGVVALGFRVLATGAPRPKWALLLGGAVAVATLIRPTTYYLPVFVAVLLVVQARSAGLRVTATLLGAFVLPVVVLVGGWQLRNHEEVGSWRYSGIESFNMYEFRAAGALARADGISFTAAQRRLHRELSSNPLAACSPSTGCVAAHPSRPGPYYDELFRRGFDVVKAHPLAATEDAVRGLWSELLGSGAVLAAPYLGVDRATLQWILLIALVCFYLAFAVGLAAVVRRPDGHGTGHVFAIGTAAYVVLVSAGPEAYARFRGPITPILALYAALGLVTAFERVHRAPAAA